MKSAKFLILSTLGLIVIASCTSQNIGWKEDKNGCNAAAGQTWSELRKDCIQIFNVGQRLNPVETKQDEAVFSAFAVFNDDK